jgi:hypothetical protein
MPERCGTMFINLLPRPSIKLSSVTLILLHNVGNKPERRKMLYVVLQLATSSDILISHTSIDFNFTFSCFQGQAVQSNLLDSDKGSTIIQTSVTIHQTTRLLMSDYLNLQMCRISENWHTVYGIIIVEAGMKRNRVPNDGFLWKETWTPKVS